MPGLGRGGAACAPLWQRPAIALQGLLGGLNNRSLELCTTNDHAARQVHGLMQVELEGQALVGMPRKLIVQGPDVSKCLLDGEGLSSAKAGSPKPSPPCACDYLFLCFFFRSLLGSIDVIFVSSQ